MSVLTRDVILRELDEGRLRIDPFDSSQVGVASIDLTLGSEIREASAFVQSGVSNRQVLEMSNVSSRALEIVPGVRVCQLVLMHTDGEESYQGRFQHQREI